MTTIPEGLQGALDRVAGWVSGTGRDKDMQLIREHIAASQQQVERLQQANAGLVGLLRKARDEFAGLPHSLGYYLTHLPEIDAAIEGQPHD